MIKCGLNHGYKDDSDIEIMIKTLDDMGLIWRKLDNEPHYPDIIYIELINESPLFTALLHAGIGISNNEIKNNHEYIWDITKITNKGILIEINYGYEQAHIFIPFTNIKIMHTAGKEIIEKMRDYKNSMKRKGNI